LPYERNYGIWFRNTFSILKTTIFLSPDIFAIIGSTITILGITKFIPRNYSIVINTLTIEARSTNDLKWK
jgi:hypothetical protein